MDVYICIRGQQIKVNHEFRRYFGFYIGDKLERNLLNFLTTVILEPDNLFRGLSCALVLTSSYWIPVPLSEL